MDFVSKRNLLLMFAAIGFLLTQDLVFATHFDHPLFIMGGLAVMIVVFTVICSVMFLLVSTIEWFIFKRHHIFKSWWQAYDINVTSLILSSIAYYITILLFILASQLTPRFEILMEHAFARSLILTSSYVIIFLFMKFLGSRNITQSLHVKKQFILFNVIFAVMFGLIMFLFMYWRFIANA